MPSLGQLFGDRASTARCYGCELSPNGVAIFIEAVKPAKFCSREGRQKRPVSESCDRHPAATPVPKRQPKLTNAQDFSFRPMPRCTPHATCKSFGGLPQVTW